MNIPTTNQPPNAQRRRVKSVKPVEEGKPSRSSTPNFGDDGEQRRENNPRDCLDHLSLAGMNNAVIYPYITATCIM